MVTLPLLEVPIVDYGDDEAAMVRYRREGEARAAALGNRGPIRFDDDGRLDPAILDAYEAHGFYVFEGVLGQDELDDIERDVADMLDRAPVTKGADVDRHGRPGARRPTARPATSCWVQPLSDPVGRHRRRQRPPPDQDDRAGAARGGARARGAAHPRLAAVLRGLPARVRPPAAAGRRRGRQRRRLHAVQRGGLDQAGRASAARWPGTRTAGRTGTAPTSTTAPTASTSWPSCTAARRPTGCGSCPARTAGARPTSRRWSPRPARIACPTPCRSCAARRRGDHQPPGRARLVRQHQPRRRG